MTSSVRISLQHNFRSGGWEKHKNKEELESEVTRKECDKNENIK